MTNPLSTLGVIHTLLSLPPLLAGFYALARHRRIDPARRSGRLYLAGLLLSVVTAFGLSSTPGVNPGHVLGVLALLAAFGGGWGMPWLARRRVMTSLALHLQAFALSFSFFLLLVPGINETLTRVPTTHPLASGPDHPVVQGALLGWLIIFMLGATLQARWLSQALRSGRIPPLAAAAAPVAPSAARSRQ